MSVEVLNLTKQFDGVPAVNDLTLQVATGEFLVLLGPSGCGKSTTMRCVAGLEQPQQGTIKLGERVVFDSGQGVDVPTHKRRVGMVFQSYAIWPHMTVRENVAFPLVMQRAPRRVIAEETQLLLERIGLGKLGDRGASQLSGGQMQRVALARSLAMRPAVILFDEPLSNLDAKLRESLRFELKELHQELGFTSIYVTHDQQEAFGLADRIAVMHNGEIQQIDTAAGLYDRPRTAFVADFLGASNILPGRARREGGQVEFSVQDLDMTVVASCANQPGAARVTHCALRPEDIRVRADIDLDTTPLGVNEFDCTVVATQLAGATLRFHLRWGERLDLYAVDRRPDEPVNPNDRVRIQIAPNRVLLLEGGNDEEARP